MSLPRTAFIKTLFHSRLLGLVAGVLLVIQSGSWLGHWLFHGSRALAEVTARKFINTPVNWLAKFAIEWDYMVFHRAGIVVMGMAAAVPISRALKQEVMDLAVPEQSKAGLFFGVRQSITCMLLCSLTAILPGLCLGMNLRGLPGEWWRIFLVVPAAFVIAIPIELLFRGVFPKLISSRFSNTTGWLLGTIPYVVMALAFSPPGLASWDTTLASLRFPVWASIADSLLWPKLWQVTAPYVLLGSVCHMLRAKRGSLWLPIGAQAAFLFSLFLGIHPMLGAISASIGSTIVLRGVKSAPCEPT